MNTPLAERMRPHNLDEVVGQKHLIGDNKILRNLIDSGNIPCPLQGIVPTHESNPGLLHCSQIRYCLSHQGKAYELFERYL